MSITDFFGWIGVIVSIIFFTSPVFKFINLFKRRIEYKDINIVIIIGNYISSIVWLIYGYEIKIQQIIVCYSIGALISLIWIWIYIVHLGKKKMSYALIYTMILTSITFALFIFLAIIIDDIKILGDICFIVCSLSYISPTQLLIKVLNSKNYKLIPIYSAIIAAIGYGSWTIFGLFKFNANIIIPNLVGLGFSFAQIILYKVYKDKKPLAEEIGNISTSVIGAVKNVVDKTVEIANSINSTNIQNNNAAPPNLKIMPETNFNNNSDNKALENSINKENFENNNITVNTEPNTSINFNTNLETNISAIDNNIKENNENLDEPKI